MLTQITQILNNSEKNKPTKAKQVNTFYWVAALKKYFATQFPHFFQPVESLEKVSDLLKNTPSLYSQLRDATNTQFRALTGGDITKEPTILKIDGHHPRPHRTRRKSSRHGRIPPAIKDAIDIVK